MTARRPPCPPRWRQCSSADPAGSACLGRRRRGDERQAHQDCAHESLHDFLLQIPKSLRSSPRAWAVDYAAVPLVVRALPLAACSWRASIL